MNSIVNAFGTLFAVYQHTVFRGDYVMDPLEAPELVRPSMFHYCDLKGAEINVEETADVKRKKNTLITPKSAICKQYGLSKNNDIDDDGYDYTEDAVKSHKNPLKVIHSAYEKAQFMSWIKISIFLSLFVGIGVSYFCTRQRSTDNDVKYKRVQVDDLANDDIDRDANINDL